MTTDYHIINTKLEQIIKKMPVRRKLIYLKKFEEGKSVKEIASELNISPKTVENQITEANKLIHKELHREETELQTFFKNIQN